MSSNRKIPKCNVLFFHSWQNALHNPGRVWQWAGVVPTCDKIRRCSTIPVSLHRRVFRPAISLLHWLRAPAHAAPICCRGPGWRSALAAAANVTGFVANDVAPLCVLCTHARRPKGGCRALAHGRVLKRRAACCAISTGCLLFRTKHSRNVVDGAGCWGRGMRRARSPLPPPQRASGNKVNK